MLTKENYLQVRSGLIHRRLPMPFLKEWCAEEKRDFATLETAFHTAIHNGFMDWVLQRLVKFFDRKYNVTVVYNVKTNKELKVF